MNDLIEIDGDMLELCSGGWGGGYGVDPVWGDDSSFSWGETLGCSAAASIGGLIGGDLGYAVGGPVGGWALGWAGSNVGSWAAREVCEWVVENGTTDTGGYNLSDLGAP